MSDIKISQLTAAATLDPNAIIPIVQTDPADGVVKNFSATASQFRTGVQLLGKLTGANMNLAASATLSYTGLSGLAFQAGDTLTDTTGATATIVSNAGTTLTLTNLNTGSGLFTAASSIAGSIGQLSYGTLSGSFTIAEHITGSTSGATATIDTSSTDLLTVSAITGTFTAGETITGGSSGATAVISAYSAPASATVSSYAITGGDQPITLSGGSSYIVTDVVITNASTSLTAAANGLLYTGADQSGYLIASAISFGTESRVGTK